MAEILAVGKDKNLKVQGAAFELELPSWIYLPTNDYDHELVAAQDAVSWMSAEEQREAMTQITTAFKRKKIKF